MKHRLLAGVLASGHALSFAAALALGLLPFIVPLSARAALQNNSYPSTGAVLSCQGRPWIDVMCYSADPTDTSDSTTAFTTAIADALTNDVPIHIPAGKYKISSTLTIDTSGFGAAGVRLIADNATLDGAAVSSGPVLLVQRSGGTTGSPAVDQNFTIEGSLSVLSSAAAYAVAIGKADFSDKFQGLRIEHLTAANASSAAGAGGIKVNYVVGARLWLGGTTAGGSAAAAAVAVEQAQDSQIAGAGAASGASAASLLVENGISTGNTFSGFNYGTTSNTCLSITAAGAALNAFVAPNFGCTTAVNATASGAGNVLVPPVFAGANRGPISGGITIVGRGALSRYVAPAASTYTALCSDDGTMFSSAAATGSGAGTWAASSLPVTLPNPATCGAGYSIGFATDASKAVVLTASAGAILAGTRSLAAMTLGPGNYEFVVLRSDGTNFRVTQGSSGSLVYNGAAAPGIPSRYEFPGGPGYQATQGDNAGVLSSSLTSSGLAVTLPSTTSVAAGWTIGLAADAMPLTVQVNGTAGGHILLPAGTSLSTAHVPIDYMAYVQFDGANFRFLPLWSTPAIGNDVRIFGAVGDGSTNDTAPIQTAWDLGPVYLPPGNWHVTDELACNGGNAMSGAGNYVSVLTVGSAGGNDFNMNANGVVQTGAIVGGPCSLTNFEIGFYQPDTGGMTLANIIHYPKALDGDFVHYGTIDKVRINAAWECFGAAGGMSGTPGGTHLGTIDCSSFNTGLYLQGNDAFFSVDTWDQETGGLTANQAAVYEAAGEAGTAQCIHLAGDVQGPAFGKAMCFAQGVTLDNGTAYNIPTSFNTLDLDGDGALLKVNGGGQGNAVRVGTLYSTKSAADTLGTLNIDGALTSVEISNCRVSAAQTSAPDILVNGGSTILNGCYYFYSSPNETPVMVTGGLLKFANDRFVLPTPATATMMSVAGGASGTLELVGNNFSEPNVARASGNPLIHVNTALSAPARLIMTGNTFLGANVVGNILEIDQDNPGNNVQGNFLNGWQVDLGFNTSVGYYDFPDVPLPVTSTPQFATNGDFAPTGGTTDATFTGNILGPALTVVSGLSGTIAHGEEVTCGGCAPNTVIQTGSGFNWTVLPAQTVANTAMTVVTPAVVGSYFRRGDFVDFHLRDTFNTNAYTTASGNFELQTNMPGAQPFEDPTGIPLSIGFIQNITFLSGQIPSSAYINGLGLIVLGYYQSAAIPLPFNTSNILPSTANVSVNVAGRYRIR